MVVWGHDLVPARTLVASARAASSEFEQFADVEVDDITLRDGIIIFVQ